MRKISKDEVFEVFIVSYIDGVTRGQALKQLFGREATQEEIAYFHDLCDGMRRGWVRMNENIRGLRKST